MSGTCSISYLAQVSQILQGAGVVVDVIDSFGASVLVGIDDGTDAVPQVTSLAQLLL